MTEFDDHNDDREGIEPEALTDDAGDPAAAFEALRHTIETQGAQIGAEMTVIRRGLEAAFDQFEKIEPQTDYKPQLAQLVQQLGVVAERLQGVEQSPILRQGAEHQARVLESAGESLVKTAAQQFDAKARELERAGGNLAAYTKSAYDRKSQDARMWMGRGFGVIAGILLTLFLPRVLPFDAAARVASAVMGDSPWQAGMRLMSFDSPHDWQRVAAADQLVEANRDEVAACREAAAKTDKDQKCSIVVKAPAQP